MAKRRKRKKTDKSRYYFTQEHEDAIVEYSRTEDPLLRAKLYSQYIEPAFNEMVDKIVYTFKFTYLPNIDDLKEDCKVNLTMILDKFDPEKGYKAFAYFSVITKNWFIQRTKKHGKQIRRETAFEDLSKQSDWETASDTDSYEDTREEAEFWLEFQKEMKNWDCNKMKPNEKRVYEAVQILFENSDEIEIFNKKAVYLYLREITGLNTKQVVNNLNKLRSRYRNWKVSWNGGEI